MNKPQYNYSEKVAEIVCNECYLTDKSVEVLKLLIIDFIAAAYAGYQYNTAFNEACEKIFLHCGGKTQATVLFSNQKATAESAAFLNSIYAHGADMDDGNRKAMGHVGVHVIPAVFALAEEIGATNKQVFEALNVGYNIYVSLAAAAQPGMVKRGFHSTGTAGAVACSAACAKLLNLDKIYTESAIAIGATQASGLLVVGDTGQCVKPINPAKAAQSGIIAAKIAQHGVVGPKHSLESDKGWFHTMSETYDLDYFVNMLKDGDAPEQCYMKIYPSCRHTHCAIDAGVELGKKINLETIKKINVHIYGNAIKLAGMYAFPKDGDESKFSIQYALAYALTTGGFSLENLKPTNLTELQKQLISITELIEDPSMENRDKGIRGARLEIISLDGSVVEKTVLIPKGDPEIPLSIDDIRYKLKACSGDMAGLDQQHNVIQNVLNLKDNGIFSLKNLFINKEFDNE